MRDDTRPAHGDAPSRSREELLADYETLLTDGQRVARELAESSGGKRAALVRTLDRLFASRVALLRRVPTFATLDKEMPGLAQIMERTKAENAAWDAARIAEAFTLDRRRPADIQMRDATEAFTRLADAAPVRVPLSDDEARAFDAARRTVLASLGCRFPFPDTDALYSNMLTFVKDDVVVHLTHDAIPVGKGLPNAHRLSAMMLLPYVDGRAEGHIAAFWRGKWDTRVVDEHIQRIIDEIAAAVG